MVLQSTPAAPGSPKLLDQIRDKSQGQTLPYSCRNAISARPIVFPRFSPSPYNRRVFVQSGSGYGPGAGDGGCGREAADG